MKAPLLIQFEGDAHTVRGFANQTEYHKHIEGEEARAKARGLKMTGYAVRNSRKTNLYVTRPANQPEPMPTLRQVRAILKQYKEGAR